MTDQAIIVSNLTKKFGNQTAVNQLSFTVKRGSIFGLLDTNGAGKSTTIDCILGTKNCQQTRFNC